MRCLLESVANLERLDFKGPEGEGAAVGVLNFLFQHVAFLYGAYAMAERDLCPRPIACGFVEPDDICLLGVLAGFYGLDDDAGSINAQQRFCGGPARQS